MTQAFAGLGSRICRERLVCLIPPPCGEGGAKRRVGVVHGSARKIACTSSSTRHAVCCASLSGEPLANEIARALRKRLTPQEVKLWVKLREMKAHGFHFRRQAPVGPYVVDFVSFRSKLVVEVDGGQHGMPEGVRSDQLRDATLQSQGFAVRRFWNSDIDANLAGVMESILSALRDPPPDRPSAGHLRASFARLDPTRGRDDKN